MPELSAKTQLPRNLLLEIAEERIREFEALGTAGLYVGAIYVGGYAIEALLKHAICVLLDQAELPMLFHTHNLEILLFYSGLQKKMQAEPEVWEAFGRINSLWLDEKNRNLPRLRYADPKSVTAKDCADMAHLLIGQNGGVVPWLRNQK